MRAIDVDLHKNTGNDARQVWWDFWELSGKRRVDILRKDSSGGDPSKMIPPSESVSVLSSIPALIIDRGHEKSPTHAGEILGNKLELEFIDPVFHDDELLIGGEIFIIDSVLKKYLGSMHIYTVKCHKR